MLDLIRITAILLFNSRVDDDDDNNNGNGQHDPLKRKRTDFSSITVHQLRTQPDTQNEWQPLYKCKYDHFYYNWAQNHYRLE